MTNTSTRSSALASRHKALGSELEDWNGMGTAWSYHTRAEDEHDAVRETVGMFDMSPLKKVFVRGPDAALVLDHLTTRDIRAIAEGASAYLCVLTEQGTIADDAIVANNGADEWTIVHGSGGTMELLQASAAHRNASIEFTDDLHNLSVQGPQSVDVLNKHTNIELEKLAYFQHGEATLFGHSCRISRTGYSGERGYEIFASASVVCDIWDHLADAGVMPCSFTALDKLRIEAGLLFYGYDMTSAHTPWEVGLGFTISRTKENFRGRDAVMAAEHKAVIRNVCIDISHTDALEGGETLRIGDEEVGVVNSPAYSHRLGKSLALAHVAPSVAHVGTELLVNGANIDTSAMIVGLPVHDPGKLRTHA